MLRGNVSLPSPICHDSATSHPLMFARLASFVSRHWVLVLLAWIAIPVGLKLVAPKWDDLTHDGDFAFLPARMTSVRGEKLLGEAFPQLISKSQVVLVAARPNGKLHSEDYDVARRLSEIFVSKDVFAKKVGLPFPPTLTVWPVASVRTWEDKWVGRMLKRTSPNGQAVLVVLQLDTELMAVDNMDFLRVLYKTLDAMQQAKDYPQGLRLGVTGSAAIGTDILFASEESIRNTEWTTIGMVILILLLIYRSPGLVIVPLLAIAVSFVVSTDLIALVALLSKNTGWFEFEVFKTSKIFIVVILFGAATDYCLFLIARYREELQRGLDPSEAIREALSRTGHALTASAMTTILGLGVMLFADFGKYRSGGPTIALSLIVALVACVTAAPALLRAVGRRVFWPFGVRPSRSDLQSLQNGPIGNRPYGVGADSGPEFDAGLPTPPKRNSFRGRVWETVAHAIVTYPGFILVASFLLLAVPAYQGVLVVQDWDRAITYDLPGELSLNREGLSDTRLSERVQRGGFSKPEKNLYSVPGTWLLKQYFPIGETGPITVLARRPGSNFNDKDLRTQITLLAAEELGGFKYTDSQGATTHPILSVRCLTNPLGSPWRENARERITISNAPESKSVFLSSRAGYAGDVTRLDLICQYDPFSKESIRLFNQIEKRLLELQKDPKSPWYKDPTLPPEKQVSFDFLGVSPGIRDLDAVNVSDNLRIGAMVSIAVLAVLVFLIRRPVISLYLIFTVLFGFFVSLGLTKLFFAWVFGDSYDGLDWKLPMFLFVILVAVGEDYNIYLVTRVFEEQQRRGLLEGLREAVIRTGGIITSCGVIMAGTFSSMITGTLRSMYELGFSLALGVLLDTFIIRTILVPAFLALWARWSGEKMAPVAEQPRGPHFDTAPNSSHSTFSKAADRRAG